MTPFTQTLFDIFLILSIGLIVGLLVAFFQLYSWTTKTAKKIDRGVKRTEEVINDITASVKDSKVGKMIFPPTHRHKK